MKITKSILICFFGFMNFACSKVSTYYPSRTFGLAHSAEAGREQAERSLHDVALVHEDLQAHLGKMKGLVHDAQGYGGSSHKIAPVTRKLKKLFVRKPLSK